MWVGKPAYLTTDPMTIQEGQWAITQAARDHHIKVRGPEHPGVNPSTQQPYRFDHPRGSPIKGTPRDGGSDHQSLPHQPLGAQTTIDVRGTKGFHCLSYHHLPQTEGSRVTGACYWQLHPCCPCQIDWRDPSIPSKGDNTKRMGALMKINLPVFKDKDAKDVVTYQSWRWDPTMYQCMGCRDLPSCHMLFGLCKATWVS